MQLPIGIPAQAPVQQPGFAPQQQLGVVPGLMPQQQLGIPAMGAMPMQNQPLPFGQPQMVQTPFGLQILPGGQTPRGGGRGRGGRNRSGNDNYLGRRVDECVTAVQSLSNAMATQQYVAAQAAQQKAAEDAAAAAEEKRLKEAEALTTSILTSVAASQEAESDKFSTALNSIADKFSSLGGDHGSKDNSSSGYGGTSGHQYSGVKRKCMAKGKAAPKPKATPRVHQAAIADNRLNMLLNRRISDGEYEPLLDFLQVDGVDVDSLADSTMQTLVDELDQNCYGTRAEWVTLYEAEVTGNPSPPARWYRSSIILRCIQKFFG